MLNLKVARNYFGWLNAYIFFHKKFYSIYHHFCLKLIQPSLFFKNSFILYESNQSQESSQTRKVEKQKIKKTIP